MNPRMFLSVAPPPPDHPKAGVVRAALDAVVNEGRWLVTFNDGSCLAKLARIYGVLVDRVPRFRTHMEAKAFTTLASELYALSIWESIE